MRILFWFAPNHQNKGGMSSKIYKIERKGKTVRAWWGPAVWDERTKRPKPATPTCLQTKSWLFRAEAAAEAFLQERLKEKLAKGYHRMPRRHSMSSHLIG